MKKTEGFFLGKTITKVFASVIGFILLTSCGEKIGPDTKDNLDENEFTYLDQACSSCNFVISTSDFLFDGEEKGVKPGDTICFQGGARSGIWIRNVVGTADKPITLINCDGLVDIDEGTSHGIRITESSYFHMTGLGSTDNEYGFDIATTSPGGNSLIIEDFSTNYEVDHIEVSQGGYAGIVCRSDATCDGSISRSTFTQYNTILHHNYIHNTGGEGMYVGGSHWDEGFAFTNDCIGTTLFEPELKGVRVYKNITDDTGRDGIQVGSATEDCKIYDNLVSNYALNNDEGHLAGFQINPGTTGDLYNNVAIGGNGYGIVMFGRGDNTIYNNVIISPGRDGILTGDRNPTSGLGFYIINNTIVNPAQKGFVIFSNQTVGTVYYNNIVANPGDKYFSFETNDIQIDTSNNLLTKDLGLFKFNDISNNDYSLKEGSIAIDAGMDVSSYGIDVDFKGNTRPVGPYDAGAFEFQNK